MCIHVRLPLSSHALLFAVSVTNARLASWHPCGSHVSLMYRELLKAMKTELSAQAAAQQQATAQLLAQALEAQKQQVGDGLCSGGLEL